MKPHVSLCTVNTPKKMIFHCAFFSNIILLFLLTDIYVNFTQDEYRVLESIGRTRVCLELTGAEEPISCPVTFSIVVDEWDATGIVWNQV